MENKDCDKWFVGGHGNVCPECKAKDRLTDMAVGDKVR